MQLEQYEAWKIRFIKIDSVVGAGYRISKKGPRGAPDNIYILNFNMHFSFSAHGFLASVPDCFLHVMVSPPPSHLTFFSTLIFTTFSLLYKSVTDPGWCLDTTFIRSRVTRYGYETAVLESKMGHTTMRPRETEPKSTIKQCDKHHSILAVLMN